MVIPKIDIEATSPSMSEIIQELQTLVPKRLPRRIAREVVPEMERALDRIVDNRLRKYPARVRHSPFVWSRDPKKNARARRWWFANKRGIYQRTGALGRAWQSSVTYSPAEAQITVSVSNPAPGASYVFGAVEFGYAQVPSHAATGWVNIGVQGYTTVIEVGSIGEDKLRTVIEDELRRLK